LAEYAASVASCVARKPRRPGCFSPTATNQGRASRRKTSQRRGSAKGRRLLPRSRARAAGTIPRAQKRKAMGPLVRKAAAATAAKSREKARGESRPSSRRSQRKKPAVTQRVRYMSVVRTFPMAKKRRDPARIPAAGQAGRRGSSRLTMAAVRTRTQRAATARKKRAPKGVSPKRAYPRVVIQ